MKKLTTRILAYCLAALMTVGLLATTAFAAETDPSDTDPGDTYFSISAKGSDQTYYGNLILGDPVMTLEPDTIYHLETQWTFHSADEALEAAKYVAMAFEYPRQCLAGRMYDLSANIYTATVNSTCIVLSFWAGDNFEIESVVGSYRLYCDDLQDGSIADVYGLDLDWDHEISVGDLARDHSCRLTFDIYTKPIIPTASNQESNATGSDGNEGTPPAGTGNSGSEPSTTPNGEDDQSSDPSEAAYDPTLPRVFKGEVDSSSRELFTEENRPDYAVFNSVTDNPNYGDETKFLCITDLGTGERYQEGAIELIPGRQYQVEIFYRNDATFQDNSFGRISRNAKGTQLFVTMPYELAAGATERFVATISADNTMPLAVSAGLNLTSRYGLYLEYADGSAVWQKDGSDDVEAVGYEKLFRDGVSLGSIGSERYGTISFIIRVTSDGSTPLAELPPETAPNSSPTNLSSSKTWNFGILTVIVSVLSALGLIALVIALLDTWARRTHPDLHKLPIIRHCVPLVDVTQVSTTEPEADTPNDGDNPS